MGGMVFDIGSVIEVKADRFVADWIPANGEPGWPVQAVGWGTVVVERDGWCVKTEIQPVVLCCRGLFALNDHFYGKDHGYEGTWIIRG